MSNREEFIEGFIECAGWCGFVFVSDSEPYSPDELGVDFTAETRSRLAEFAGEFFDEHYDILAEVWEPLSRNLSWWGLGIDLWLSSHGHGAGYFARGSEPVWGRLQDIARHSGAPDDCFSVVEVEGTEFASL